MTSYGTNNGFRLPGPEALKESGIREGQTKIVRDIDEVICYSWSLEEKAWKKLGNVDASTPILFKTSRHLVSEVSIDFYSIIDTTYSHEIFPTFSE